MVLERMSSMPAWLKGVIGGIIAYVIIQTISMISLVLAVGSCYDSWTNKETLLCHMIAFINHNLKDVNPVIGIIIISITSFILTGALIGWIIGKIKERR